MFTAGVSPARKVRSRLAANACQSGRPLASYGSNRAEMPSMVRGLMRAFIPARLGVGLIATVNLCLPKGEYQSRPGRGGGGTDGENKSTQIGQFSSTDWV